MSDSTPDSEHAQLEAVRVAFPAWFITRAAFGGYHAEWKSESGLQIRYVAGISVADLHRRLEVIEAARGDNDEHVRRNMHCGQRAIGSLEVFQSAAEHLCWPGLTSFLVRPLGGLVTTSRTSG